MPERKKHTTIAPTLSSTAKKSPRISEPQGSRTDHMHSPYLLVFFYNKTLMMMTLKGRAHTGEEPFC